MTNKEVTEKIDDILNEEFLYEDSFEHMLTAEDSEWLKDIRIILERLIPKEPYKTEGTEFFYCSDCGIPVTFNTKGHNQPSFCWNCGQAINWDFEGNKDEIFEYRQTKI